MTRPVPNLGSALVDKLGKVIPPWNAWFQQFSQNAPAAVSIPTLTGSPYQANKVGTVFIDTGTVVKLTRGLIIIILGAGSFIIPIGIGDIVSWSSAASVKFLEQ